VKELFLRCCISNSSRLNML